jgi:hypothetical protein
MNILTPFPGGMEEPKPDVARVFKEENVPRAKRNALIIRVVNASAAGTQNLIGL